MSSPGKKRLPVATIATIVAATLFLVVIPRGCNYLLERRTQSKVDTLMRDIAPGREANAVPE